MVSYGGSSEAGGSGNVGGTGAGVRRGRTAPLIPLTNTFGTSKRQTHPILSGSLTPSSCRNFVKDARPETTYFQDTTQNEPPHHVGLILLHKAAPTPRDYFGPVTNTATQSART